MRRCMTWRNGTVTANGVLCTGTGRRSDQYHASCQNYWVDVVLHTGLRPQKTNLAVSRTTHVTTLGRGGEGGTLELGRVVQVRREQDTLRSFVIFYKGVNNTGTHTGTLWSSAQERAGHRRPFKGRRIRDGIRLNLESVGIRANTGLCSSYYTTGMERDWSYFAGKGFGAMRRGDALANGNGEVHMECMCTTGTEEAVFRTPIPRKPTNTGSSLRVQGRWFRCQRHRRFQPQQGEPDGAWPRPGGQPLGIGWRCVLMPMSVTVAENGVNIAAANIGEFTMRPLTTP